jgi:hypothetical protein
MKRLLSVYLGVAALSFSPTIALAATTYTYTFQVPIQLSKIAPERAQTARGM